MDDCFFASRSVFLDLKVIDQTVMEVVAALFDHSSRVEPMNPAHEKNEDLTPRDPHRSGRQQQESREPSGRSKLNQPRVNQNPGQQKAERPKAERQQTSRQFCQLDLLSSALQLLFDILIELATGGRASFGRWSLNGHCDREVLTL